MADSTQKNDDALLEEEYSRQLREAKSKPQGLISRLGSGKAGKIARAGALAMGLASGARPQVAEESIQKAREDSAQRNRQVNSQTLPESVEDMQRRQYEQSGLPQFEDPTQQTASGAPTSTFPAGASTPSMRGVAGKGVELGGKGVEFAGRATELTGKGLEQGGKGAQYAGKGMKQGGMTMARAGAGLSETGIGAIAGVPMMAAGGLTAAAGQATEVAGKGAEIGGRAAKGVGKGARRAGGSVENFGSRMQNMGGAAGDLAKSGMESAQTASQLAGAATNPAKVAQLLAKRELEQTKLAAKQAMSGDVTGAIETTINTASGSMLKWAWIVAIPTFGLSMLYVNFHFVAHYIYGSQRFCAFGQEWGLSIPMVGGGLAKSLNMQNGPLEIVEAMGMVVLDIVILTGLLVFSASVALVLCIVGSPIQAITGALTCR